MGEGAKQNKNWLGETSKEKRNNIIVIALAGALLAVLVLYFLQGREHNQIVREIKTEKDSLRNELTQIVANYDSLSIENDSITSMMEVAQTKVKDLLIEIEQTKKVSYKKISGYQKQVSTLRGIMRDFVVQIDSLNARNQELMAENQEVKQQFVQSENKNQQLEQEKSRLQKNLQRASMLEARGLIAEPINQRSKPTKYAKRAEKIRVSLSLSKNVATKRGAKNIYVRIRRPDQLLLSESANNLFRFEDSRIQYTSMREVNYEGQELPVAIYWDNTGNPQMMVGEYTVDIFADGNNIGTTTFELK